MQVQKLTTVLVLAGGTRQVPPDERARLTKLYGRCTHAHDCPNINGWDRTFTELPAAVAEEFHLMKCQVCGGGR
jgi:hypothetical protein